METGIKEFCINYKNKLKNDKDIKVNELHSFKDDRERITFNISMRSNCPMGLSMSDNRLFNLDKEDLEYLYNKYSKKVKEELEKNIAEIKSEYEGM